MREKFSKRNDEHDLDKEIKAAAVDSIVSNIIVYQPQP